MNRIITTDLIAFDETLEVIASVFGQLSDGIWENSRCESYWKDIDYDKTLDGYLVFEIEPREYVDKRDYWRGFWYRKNRYYGMTDADVCRYLAKKIQQIVAEERRNYPMEDYRFRADNSTFMKYMGHHYCNVTVGDAYCVRQALLDFAKGVEAHAC